MLHYTSRSDYVRFKWLVASQANLEQRTTHFKPCVALRCEVPVCVFMLRVNHSATPASPTSTTASTTDKTARPVLNANGTSEPSDKYAHLSRRRLPLVECRTDSDAPDVPLLLSNGVERSVPTTTIRAAVNVVYFFFFCVRLAIAMLAS